MSDSDNLVIESDQPPGKKTKSHYDTLPSYNSTQSSQESQNIIIEIGHHPDQLNKTYIIVNNNKKERQIRYRERNRDKLKQREAKRRKRIQSQNILGPFTSSKSNIMKVNNEELPTTAISLSSSGVEKMQRSSTQRIDQDAEMNALQNKRDHQQRYREKNRDKLKQREAERRRRLQNAESITELYSSPNIERREIFTEPIIIIDGVVETPQQNLRNASSANIAEIPSNYSKFRYHITAHKYFNDNCKNNDFGHACSICDRLWFEKDLKKPSTSGNIINTIVNEQNVDSLKICSTCKSALDKENIPNLSVYNGFHYPKIPRHLPKIDFITERLKTYFSTISFYPNTKIEARSRTIRYIRTNYQ